MSHLNFLCSKAEGKNVTPHLHPIFGGKTHVHLIGVSCAPARLRMQTLRQVYKHRNPLP